MSVIRLEDLENELLIALYHEWRAGKEMVPFSYLMETYKIEMPPGYLILAHEDMISRGMITGPSNRGIEEMTAGRISPGGIRMLENVFPDRMDAFQSVNKLPDGIKDISAGRILFGDGPIPAGFEGKDGDIYLRSGAPDAIDSAKWTGLTSQHELTEQRRSLLVRDLGIAEQNLEILGESQEVRAQARAYIIAIRSLAEAPDPPTDIIWMLLNRAATIATIAQLFIPLILALSK